MLDDALRQHGIGDLLEARDVRSHDVVTLVAVTLGSIVGRVVNGHHDVLELVVNLFERPGKTL